VIAAVPVGDPINSVSIPYARMLPEIILVTGALLVLTVSSLIRKKSRPGLWAACTVIIGLGSLVSAAWVWNDVSDHGARAGVSSAVAIDGFSIFIIIAISSAVVIGALVAESYLTRERLDGPEFYVLSMLSASGGMLMASANDLIVLFLGLEILSIALYILTGYHRRRAESGEAAMKYFVLGAFSSALFLYGVALSYGATGSTNLTEIAAFLANNVVVSNGVLLAGMALLLVGLGFKVAAVPFHTWTPDVYQGAPTPATGFMAAVAKAAGFAGLLRVFFSTFSTLRLEWQPIVWVIAVITLIVGSVLALVQTDVKRMLAYSSISHAGYVLVGLQAGTSKGVAGALFYLLAYTFMVLGSFAVVTVVGGRGDDAHTLDAYRGLAKRRPGLALAFAVLLMAQAGVPFTTGFFAKFYVILAAVSAHSYGLAIIAMLAASVAAFFYLRVIVYMFMSGDETEEAPARPRLVVPGTIGIALAITLAFTLVVGVAPSPVIDFARRATLLF
jgi:NADH-quinone oxidoreductase subunit N